MSPAAAQQTAIGRGGDPGPIFLKADPVQLQVALRAMCQNSLEALQNGGRVEIVVEMIATGDSSGADIPVCPVVGNSPGRRECLPHLDGGRNEVRFTFATTDRG